MQKSLYFFNFWEVIMKKINTLAKIMKELINKKRLK